MLYSYVSRFFQLLIAICAGLMAASCQPITQSTPTALPTATAGAAYTPQPRKIETDINGVEITVNVPPDWQAQSTSDGILMAERPGSMQSNSRLMGMQMHIFTHETNDFGISMNEGENDAWAILKFIVKKQEYIGNAIASEPQGFTWNGYDAAYYLLNDGYNNVTLLMAVVTDTPKRLVAFNISCPLQRADLLRDVLPELLDGLTINNEVMDVVAMHDLPDPLPFPTVVEATASAP